MSIAQASDLLTELVDAKNPDVSTLLQLREHISGDGSARKEAMDALDAWSSSRERQGVLLYLLGQTARAHEILETEAASKWGKHFYARALLDCGFAKMAEKILSREFNSSKAAEAGMPLFRAQLRQGKYDDAAKTLKLLNSDAPAAQAAAIELKYRQEGLSETADEISALSELFPNDRHVNFTLGIIGQAAGDDDTARHAYERVAQHPPVPVDVLINLGTLYEDEGFWELAIKCYDTVLVDFPTHRRAQLFRADAEASMNMYYDEDRERKEDKRLQILRTPVTDFELSVRSRNCLQKMKIDTLGDLIMKTESELLSYKNFGETSLQEIKSILASKSLRLGMRQEDALSYMPPDGEGVEPPATDDKLAQSIDTLELSVRSRRCMERMSIKTIGDLLTKSEAELVAAPNFGQTSLNEVRQKLAELGISLAG